MEVLMEKLLNLVTVAWLCKRIPLFFDDRGLHVRNYFRDQEGCNPPSNGSGKNENRKSK